MVDEMMQSADSIVYREIEGRGAGYYAWLLALGALIAAGLGAAYYMESQGHYVTGMSNQIVWGMPHVFAVFLIVAASGALNVASMASVFGRVTYKPLARLSGLLAIALLIGGLAVLVLDLGRPDRLIVAMTHYNFRSIFAWNIFLYTGFMAVVAVYLWMMMERRMNRYTRTVGLAAFVWRLVLTTGTGSIFGFLVAREAYDAAIMAPLFIAMSLAFGQAITILVVMAVGAGTGRIVDDAMLVRMKNLLGVLVAAVFYFVLAYHLTKLYATGHQGVERFILLDGGVYTAIFWVAQILIGALLPLLIFYGPRSLRSRFWVAVGAALVLLGGLAQVYLIIIGGQAYPMSIFPGKEIIASSFFDGVVASYSPGLPEFILGLSGVAIALLIMTFGIRVLRIMPEALDVDTD